MLLEGSGESPHIQKGEHEIKNTTEMDDEVGRREPQFVTVGPGIRAMVIEGGSTSNSLESEEAEKRALQAQQRQ